MVRGGVSTGPYTKLVPRSLLIDNDIRFEEGITNEDVMWTAEVLSSANSVMLLGEPLYRYIARAGSVTNTFQAGTVIVFDNCRKLESFIARHHPGLLDSCATYCARSCWNVILAASRGDNKKRFPESYDLAMRELQARRRDIARCCTRPKEVLLRLLVELRVYGWLKK